MSGLVRLIHSIRSDVTATLPQLVLSRFGLSGLPSFPSPTCRLFPFMCIVGRFHEVPRPAAGCCALVLLFLGSFFLGSFSASRCFWLRFAIHVGHDWWVFSLPRTTFFPQEFFGRTSGGPPPLPDCVSRAQPFEQEADARGLRVQDLSSPVQLRGPLYHLS